MAGNARIDWFQTSEGDVKVMMAVGETFMGTLMGERHISMMFSLRESI